MPYITNDNSVRSADYQMQSKREAGYVNIES